MTLTLVEKKKQKTRTYSLRAGGETLLKTQYRKVAEDCVITHFSNIKSVSMIDNAIGKTVARWNYGHRQEVKNR